MITKLKCLENYRFGESNITSLFYPKILLKSAKGINIKKIINENVRQSYVETKLNLSIITFIYLSFLLSLCQSQSKSMDKFHSFEKSVDLIHKKLSRKDFVFVLSKVFSRGGLVRNTAKIQKVSC